MDATQTQVRLVGHVKGTQRQFNCYGKTWQDAAIHVYRMANLSADEATVVISDLDENVAREFKVVAQVAFTVEGLRGGE